MPPPVLLTAEGLTHAFGARPLFEGLGLVLHQGDAVGLVGPNGTGKSTLLAILAGRIEADAGRVALRRGARVGLVPQDPVFAPGRTAEQVVAEAVSGLEGLAEHERLHRVALALGRAGFERADQPTETLSGGWRKRLAIARELALEPEILLLDEPTNHLDLEGILWLEATLRSEPRAFVAVSHDRTFLQSVARRMLDLDPALPGGLLAVDGSYADLLEERDALLAHQAAYEARLANLVRREIEWLRRGPKARTTKAKARIDAAGRLGDELAEVRARSVGGTAGIGFSGSGRRTKRLWECRDLRKRLGGKLLVEGLDLLLGPGRRLGVLGANGSGKTTLLRLMVGDLEPDGGTIERADGLRVVYFEQNRESLDEEATLRRALAPTGDTVVYQERAHHVASWAKRFLFPPDQLDQPVSRLSGGEKARVVLARLLLRPADLLVVDEPTNDLDIPTLEVLEEALLEFPGALVLVTHDRFLLDRVTDSVLALDGRGGAVLFADVHQWERAREAAASSRKGGEKGRSADGAAARSRPGGLSWKEKREWERMEESVLQAEERVEEARRSTEDPAIATDAEVLGERFAALQEARGEVERLYARWAELEEKRGGS